MKNHHFLKGIIFLLGLQTIHASDLNKDPSIFEIGRKVIKLFIAEPESSCVSHKTEELPINEQIKKSQESELNRLTQHHLSTQDLQERLATVENTLVWKKKRYKEFKEREKAISKAAFDRENEIRKLSEENALLKNLLKAQEDAHQKLQHECKSLKKEIQLLEEDSQNSLKNIPEVILMEAGDLAKKSSMTERTKKVKDYLMNTHLLLNNEQIKSILSYLGISEDSLEERSCDALEEVD